MRDGKRPGSLRQLATVLSLAGVAVVFTLVFLEIGLRVFFSFKVGPSVLLHGLSERRHIAPGYTKYLPHQKRVDTDLESGETFEVTINSQGFRGPEFETQKKNGVLRVITLGASSTFGFRSRDHDTYPAQLQEILNDRCGDEISFEVINLGVPHLLSKHIVALFLAEGVPLDPDVVTFYEGVNDSASTGGSGVAAVSAVKKGLRRFDRVRHLYRQLRESSVLVGLLSRSLSVPVEEVAEADFGRHVQAKSQAFLENVSQLREECEKRGIRFVVANQQARSLAVERAELRGVSYEEEVELVRRRREETSLTEDERYFLIHAELMRNLEKWARETNAEFVDVIGGMDDERDEIVSWVHLSPEGNRRVAELLADAILRSGCPSAGP